MKQQGSRDPSKSYAFYDGCGSYKSDKEKLKIHTEDEIIALIDLSINRQWKNIIWSKLEGESEGMKTFYDGFAL